ncbi:MAG: leucine-rich repeat domain-containing protein, partial [Acutalibacteraceae bacterium]|nr:leucine-rich repeat domain-containing protein [Acutalibacteraceae bacterium]
MKKTHKIISILLVLAMMLTMAPLTAFATEIVASGDCGAEGNNATWTLDSDGLLTIRGTGAMEDYIGYSAPWYSGISIDIKNVVVENGVTSIGNYAFQNCKNLEKVTLPDSITGIGSRAFDMCRSMTEINIPDNVTSIGSDAFHYCTSLTEITIPAGVTRIEEGVFYHCSNLTNINLPKNLEYIGSVAMGMCENLKKLIIPDGVTAIADNTFYGAGLTEITIPDSITAIGDYAFYSCSGLTEITIPNSVTAIAEGAFAFCSSLTEITIPDSVTVIGKAAFYSCSGLTEITIPDSVTTIGESAFLDCSKLATVNVPCVWDGTLYSFDDAVTLNLNVHKFTEYKQTKAPKCDAVGEEISECDHGCGATDKRDVPVVDHDWLNNYGFCANGCGAECPHENFTDGICDDCGIPKADYTAYFDVMNRYNSLLDKNKDDLTDSAKEYIRAEVQKIADEYLGGQGIKNNYSEKEQHILDGITDGFNKICDYIEKGVADGTIVKVDGLAFLSELSSRLNYEIMEKYDRDTLMNFTHSEAALQRTKEIEEFAKSLSGTVAENEENLAKLEADIIDWYADSEACLNGKHNLDKSVSNNDATCKSDGTKTGVCI